MKKLAIVFVLLISCGGGGGGDDGDSGPPPKINDVRLAKITDSGYVETLAFEFGDEINMDVWATDPDLNMVELFITEYRNTGIELIPNGQTRQLLPDQGDVDMHYYFLEDIVITNPVGNYRECFYIVDKKGNESNDFCINIVVTN